MVISAYLDVFLVWCEHVARAPSETFEIRVFRKANIWLQFRRRDAVLARDLFQCERTESVLRDHFQYRCTYIHTRLVRSLATPEITSFIFLSEKYPASICTRRRNATLGKVRLGSRTYVVSNYEVALSSRSEWKNKQKKKNATKQYLSASFISARNRVFNYAKCRENVRVVGRVCVAFEKVLAEGSLFTENEKRCFARHLKVFIGL